MDLNDYFNKTRGLGVLATADRSGQVDTAIYSRPHIMPDGTMAFIMNDRLSHHYLQSNPHAAYLFREAGDGFAGKRFFLTKVAEEQDTERLREMRRRTYPDKAPYAGPKFLVFFQIDKELPLIGSGDEED